PTDGQKFEKSPDPEPAKPAKLNFGGFAGSTSGLFQNFEVVSGTTDQISPEASIIGKSPTTEPPKPPKPPFEVFKGSTPGEKRPEPEPLKPSIPSVEVSPNDPNAMYLACTCSARLYPHLRHRDGSGPGSGRKLDHYDRRQAHWSRRVE